MKKLLFLVLVALCSLNAKHFDDIKITSKIINENLAEFNRFKDTFDEKDAYSSRWASYELYNSFIPKILDELTVADDGDGLLALMQIMPRLGYGETYVPSASIEYIVKNNAVNCAKMLKEKGNLNKVVMENIDNLTNPLSVSQYLKKYSKNKAINDILLK